MIPYSYLQVYKELNIIKCLLNQCLACYILNLAISFQALSDLIALKITVRIRSFHNQVGKLIIKSLYLLKLLFIACSQLLSHRNPITVAIFL